MLQWLRFGRPEESAILPGKSNFENENEHCSKNYGRKTVCFFKKNIIKIVIL